MDTKKNRNNPYSIEQRKAMIRKVYGSKVKIISIPPIESVNIGRNTGYDIIRHKPPKSIAEISSSNIRRNDKNGSISYEIG